MKDLMTYETKQIEICDVDYMGQYQLCHLLNRFAEIATINAKEIGLWNEAMMNQYGWVVAKQAIHLDEPIYHKDIIELSTIVANGSFVAFPRYYFIKKNEKMIKQVLDFDENDQFVRFSSFNKTGVQELWDAILKLC